MSKLAFIGGTGVYDARILSHVYSEVIDTPFGKVPYEVGSFGEKEIIFIIYYFSNFNTYAYSLWSRSK